VLESPEYEAPEDIYTETVSPEKAPDRATQIKISFKDGIPTRVQNMDDGTIVETPLELFVYLNELGKINGIGRIGYQWGGKSALWNDETMTDEFVARARKWLAGREGE
jgi:argininosuccinate synthase